MPDENIVNMENLMPADFRALDRDRTCVVMPFAPIENHGDHLPLGTDYFTAHEAMRSAARKFSADHPDWKFLFIPVIPLGADAVPHGGSLWVKPRVIRMVASEMAECLVNYGFKYIALFSGHGGYRQMTVLEEVAIALRLKHARKGVRAFMPLTYLFARAASIDFVDMLNERLPAPLTEDEKNELIHETHGGKCETSYILHIKPELMDEGYRSAADRDIEPAPLAALLLKGAETVLPEHMKEGARALAAAMTWFLGGAEKGYMGFPSRASAEFGAALHDTVAVVFSRMLEEVLIEGKIPGDSAPLFAALKILAG